MGNKYIRVLTPTKQKIHKKITYSIDVETHTKKQLFLCATIRSPLGDNWFFTDKRELINFLKTDIFMNSEIAITNIGFDWFVIFQNEPEEKDFKILRPKNTIISIASYIVDGEFSRLNSRHKKKCILTFIDTLNFSSGSVTNMGKILNIPKLECGIAIGTKPKNDEEWQLLKTYNERDALITCEFMKLFTSIIEQLGGTRKLTIASTSMTIFRNKYLNERVYQPDPEILQWHFKGYYGGRVECRKRGHDVDLKLFDVNSLFPFEMKDKQYPFLNTLRVSQSNTLRYIMDYEGMSDVDVFIPPDKFDFCPLPFKTPDGRNIYPSGHLSGVWCHPELRNALELGCEITKVRCTHYCTKTWSPFKEMVDEIYNKRLEFQKEANPAEFICKIILNSGYGKFGQKNDGMKELIHMDEVTTEMMEDNPNCTPIGKYMEFTKPPGDYAVFCIPMIAAYVTCYARLELFKYLNEKENDVYYCDTDSIVTKRLLPTSNKLGDIKLEADIANGWFVRKKFYCYQAKNGKEKVKLKGVPKAIKIEKYDESECKIVMTNTLLNCDIFVKALKSEKPKYIFDRFAKLRYALLNNLNVGELFEDDKVLNLEDDSRDWDGMKFNANELQISKPINMDHVMVVDPNIKKKRRQQYEKELYAKYITQNQQYTNDDTYDSIGNDIGKDEFLENEKFFQKME